MAVDTRYFVRERTGYSASGGGTMEALIIGSLTNLHAFHNGATVAADGTAFAVGGFQTMTVYISGTSTSRTVEFKCLPPGAATGDYRPLMGVRLSDLSTGASTAGNNEVWQFDLTGLDEILMDLVAVAGGNVTIKGKAVA